MAGFPSVKPAFTIQVTVAPPLSVGSAHRKTSLTIVPMTGGTITSEAGFSPAIHGEFVGTGNDYIHVDPDNERMRLDAHGVVKTNDGALIYLNYKGTVRLTPEVKSIFAGQAGDLATPFGDAFTYITFETGDERYKDLENGVFVAQGRFVNQKDKPLVVEYRVGQVVQG
ncbi:hypothetical protein VTN77DRAFT_9267 [Rasamsonia byssochlamydoides]|uniref:uncharacterized protein n=1 Tax=Rasamsonia byssochlamydoides TaxID=89139 RepID=UPI0037425E38